jgi:hypothetical protein
LLRGHSEIELEAGILRMMSRLPETLVYQFSLDEAANLK